MLHNLGHVRLTVAARAHFSASWGGNSELDLGQAVILFNSIGIIRSNWQQAPPFEGVNSSVVIGYSDRKRELVNKSQTGEFWVVPWNLIGIIVGIMGVVIPAIVIVSRDTV